MALRACSECSKEISDKAATCPHCGAPTTANSSADAAVGDHFIAPQEVSEFAALLFGPFYFFFKGWFVSGIIYAIVTFLSGGLWWVFGPIFAQAIVNKFEGGIRVKKSES